MKKNYLSTTITALMLSLASLTLPPGGVLEAADIFTKITASPGGDIGNSRGAAWGDYDGDGFIDLIVTQVGPGSNSVLQFLYHNNGNGTFSRVTNGPVAAVLCAGYGAAWADYDNDGNLDLILVNWNQPNYLFHNNGNGTFMAVPSSVSTDIIATSRGVSFVDYNGDGYVDIFRTAQINDLRRLYHNNRDGTFTRHHPARFPQRAVGGLQQRSQARPFPAASQRSGRLSQLPVSERRRRHVYSRGRRNVGWQCQFHGRGLG